MRCSSRSTRVTGIVERRHTLPILANVLIEKRGNSLSFLATDLEIQITTAHLDSAAGEDFRLTTSAKKTAGHPACAARHRHGDAGPAGRQAGAEGRQEPL